ncbi:MAG: hypothetical protein QXP02_06300 [Desulfurococcaceae archaeon]
MGEDLASELDSAIDIIDKIEGIINRLRPGEKISEGIVYSLYENLVLLREKIVEARFKALKCNA